MRYYCAGALLLNLCAEYVVLYTVHADDELPVANELLNTLFAAQCCIVDGGRQSHVRVRRRPRLPEGLSRRCCRKSYPDKSGGAQKEKRE